MRKSWKRFWLAAAASVGGLGAFVYCEGETAQQVKMTDGLVYDFLIPNSHKKYPLLFKFSEASDTTERCAEEAILPESLGDLVATHCKAKFGRYLEQPCVVLQFAADLGSCPRTLARVFEVLRQPCNFVESRSYVHQRMECDGEKRKVTSIAYVPGAVTTIVANYQ